MFDGASNLVDDASCMKFRSSDHMGEIMMLPAPGQASMLLVGILYLVDQDMARCLEIIEGPSGSSEQAQRSWNHSISKSPELWVLTLESV
ncbi:hypothetical protein QUC31_008289 [Theobroma cacao]